MNLLLKFASLKIMVGKTQCSLLPETDPNEPINSFLGSAINAPSFTTTSILWLFCFAYTPCMCIYNFSMKLYYKINGKSIK